MAKSKNNKNVLGYVFAALILVGLILVVVGMFVGQVTAKGTLLGKTDSKTIALFDSDAWKVTEVGDKKIGVSNVFGIISFIVTLVGAAVLAINAVLKMLGKDFKLLGYIGAAVTLVGAILILVAGLVMAGQCGENLTFDIGFANTFFSAGAGVWLGFIGGLVAAVAGGLSSLKKFN